jgi:hypothetical protein
MPKIEQRPFRALLIAVTVKNAVLVSLAYIKRSSFASSPAVGAATSPANDPALVENGGRFQLRRSAIEIISRPTS